MKRLILTAFLSVSALMWSSAASADTCVRIDIKPQSCPNAINTNCNGNDNGPNAVIAVAILGSCCTDVTTICSVTFEVNGGTGPQSPVRECSLEDVNDDGILDLVCHFRRCDLGIDCSTTMGTIRGDFCNDGSFIGIDSIRPVPCND